MESFRQRVRNRLIFAGIYCAIILILTAISRIVGLNNSATDFTLGFGIGIEVVVIFIMGKNLGALKNEDKLKKLYVEENDERQKYIDAKIGGTGINIALVSLSLAMLISNYFSQIVFFTLLSTTLFIVAIKFALKIYYSKRV